MFLEHNNRKKADKFAEYITGKELRKYVCGKVEQYVGKNVSVFDGAAGSGQLEQFIKPSQFVAVEIQAESCEALKSNYPESVVFNESFFTYQTNQICDCVVMNPPFSIKLKDLSEEERIAIQSEFEWKKSGVVDDIFTLKGLFNSKRWGFFILFPGVSYRQTEKKFRSLIGNQLVELNRIRNAFEDTSIDVMFLVIDKLKVSNLCKRELINCAKNQIEILNQDEWEIDPEHWELIQDAQEEREIVYPFEIEAQARKSAIDRIVWEVRLSKMLAEQFEPRLRKSFNDFIDDICTAVQAERING